MKNNAAEQLTDYLVGQGLKSTQQRDKILRVFMDAGRHVSAEELSALVKKSHPGIGYVTVYRTLKLLADAGLAEARRFEDGFTRYEYNTASGHHDHLICMECSKSIEFYNPEIDALQDAASVQLGFRVMDHKLQIYGVCQDCRT